MGCCSINQSQTKNIFENFIQKILSSYKYLNNTHFNTIHSNQPNHNKEKYELLKEFIDYISSDTQFSYENYEKTIKKRIFSSKNRKEEGEGEEIKFSKSFNEIRKAYLPAYSTNPIFTFEFFFVLFGLININSFSLLEGRRYFKETFKNIVDDKVSFQSLFTFLLNLFESHLIDSTRRVFDLIELKYKGISVEEGFSFDDQFLSDGLDLLTRYYNNDNIYNMVKFIVNDLQSEVLNKSTIEKKRIKPIVNISQISLIEKRNLKETISSQSSKGYRLEKDEKEEMLVGNNKDLELYCNEDEYESMEDELVEEVFKKYKFIFNIKSLRIHFIQKIDMTDKWQA